MALSVVETKREKKESASLARVLAFQVSLRRDEDVGKKKGKMKERKRKEERGRERREK